MEVHIVVQGDLSFDPVIIQVFRHYAAACECRDAGTRVGLDRYIVTRNLENQYDRSYDYSVCEEEEEQV